MTLELSRRDVIRFSALGLGTAAIAGLAGCAPSGSSASTAAASRLPTAFSFGSWTLSEDAAKAPLQAALDTFSKANDGVAISPVTYPYNDYLNQLTLQVRGGQFTGAVQLDVAWLSAMAALGKLVDLAPYAKDRGYTPAALAAGKLDGAQYGLPWTIAAIGLIGNQELLDKAGASSAPTTIDEFEDGLKALKGIGVIPYAASTKAAQLKDVIVWMQTFGSPIIEDGECTIGDAGSVKAMEWYKRLYDDGLIAPDMDRAGARTLFAQGATAIYDDALVGKAPVVEQSPDADLASKMTPIARPLLKEGDTPQEVLWGHLVAVVGGGEGEATASEFAQWLTSDPDQTLAYFEALSLPPTTEEALQSEEVAADPFVTAFSNTITVDAKASPLWQFPTYGQMETAIAEQVQAVLIGQASPKDAMAAAGAAVTGMI